MRRILSASGPWLPAFAVWTLFVWGVRIKNADGSVGAVLLSLTFVVPALALLALLAWRGRGQLAMAVTRLLAVWTALVWIVRIVDIVVLSEHAGGFKVVHAGLGAVSIALATAASRVVGRDRDAERAPTYS